MTQSTLRVGPHVLLPTLEFHHWISGYPTGEECGLFRIEEVIFHIESKVSSRTTVEAFTRFRLVAFSIQNDIGSSRLDVWHEGV